VTGEHLSDLVARDTGSTGDLALIPADLFFQDLNGSVREFTVRVLADLLQETVEGLRVVLRPWHDAPPVFATLLIPLGFGGGDDLPRLPEPICLPTRH
jgi:hypothetical protein